MPADPTTALREECERLAVRAGMLRCVTIDDDARHAEDRVIAEVELDSLCAFGPTAHAALLALCDRLAEMVPAPEAIEWTPGTVYSTAILGRVRLAARSNGTWAVRCGLFRHGWSGVTPDTTLDSAKTAAESCARALAEWIDVGRKLGLLNPCPADSGQKKEP